MSKILTGKLSASVEHPIICKTIQKSTDLEQYHGEFASFFFSVFFSTLNQPHSMSDVNTKSHN